MTDSDRLKFAAYLAGMAEVLNAELSEIKITLYFEALKDLDLEDINRACSYLIQTSKFFPKPAEIREVIHGNAEDRAMIALQQVKQAIAEYGTYKSVSFGDKKIHAVVKALGGWVALGEKTYDEWVWIEKDFLKIYRAFLGRDVECPDHLVGLTEHANAVKGIGEEWYKERGLPAPRPVMIGAPAIDRHLPLGPTEGNVLSIKGRR